MTTPKASKTDNPFDALSFELKELALTKENEKQAWGVFVRSMVPGGHPYICRLVDGSPASAAGVKVNDYVLSVNNQRVETKTQMAQWVGQVKSGNLALTIARRRSKPLELSALKPPNGERRPNFNYHICRLDPMRRSSLGMNLGQSPEGHVLVVNCSSDGSAFWSGLQGRDRLVTVSSTVVRDLEQCNKLLKESEGKPLDILIERPADAESNSQGVLDQEASFQLQRLSLLTNTVGAGVPETPKAIQEMMKSRVESIMKNFMKKKGKKKAKSKAKSDDESPKENEDAGKKSDGSTSETVAK